MFDNLQGPGRGGGDITMELRCGNATCSRENSLLMPSVCGGLCRGGEQGLSRFARFLPETMRVNALTVGNQDSLQRGLRLEHSPSKGSCPSGWKPGLASKRIATLMFASLLPCAFLVGNQDSLQRGLRPFILLYTSFASSCRLETRTRFKEDCDHAVPSRGLPHSL